MSMREADSVTAAAVERVHRVARQMPARIARSVPHRSKRTLRVALSFKILPQRAADMLARILERRRLC